MVMLYGEISVKGCKGFFAKYAENCLYMSYSEGKYNGK